MFSCREKGISDPLLGNFFPVVNLSFICAVIGAIAGAAAFCLQIDVDSVCATEDEGLRPRLLEVRLVQCRAVTTLGLHKILTGLQGDGLNFQNTAPACECTWERSSC